MFRGSTGIAFPTRAYQNFFVSETRSWEGVNYLFAPFSIDGDFVSNISTGSRSVLVAPANLLTQAIAAEAAMERWLLEIKYVFVTGVQGTEEIAWSESSTVANDIWLCSGYRASHGDGSVQIELSSPLDAVEARTPNCVLQEWQVGSLPVSGSLLLS